MHMPLRSPSSTVDDCHKPLLEAIGHEIMQRAQAGYEAILLKVRSHVNIHGKELADKLANEELCRFRRATPSMPGGHAGGMPSACAGSGWAV